MWPVILQIGPLTIYSYGTMLAVGFLLAGYLTAIEMDRRGLPGAEASSFVVWAAVGGLAGSRIWALAEDWRRVLESPIQAIFSGSGFVFYGGLIGGTAAVSWAIRRRGLPWLKVVDCIAPGLVLAQAIGRIGCQLAGDGDWGAVTGVPWGMAYPNAIIGWDYPPGVRVHPTPIYETLAYTAVFAFLWSIRKRPLPDGSLFWSYLVLAAGARFLVEFVRINRAVLAGLTEAQLTSALLVAIGAAALLLRRGQPAAEPVRVAHP
jgi:phosphatidylglycerol:prolipoprotein diacylglycerol transferase